jgi:hypothetical protein
LLTLTIGSKEIKQIDRFAILVTTPEGLGKLPSKEGIVATRPLLVMDRYDFQSLWAWLQKAMSACEGETWLDCVNELQRYFRWEHEAVRSVRVRVRPEIRFVTSWDFPDIQTWEPDDPSDVAVELMVDIGPKGKKEADLFTIRMATPKGLSRLRAEDGIVAVMPLVVMDRYDHLLLRAWLESTSKNVATATA